jgi:exodeoxyribonuclease VII large subunit
MIKKDSRVFTVSAVNRYIHSMFDQDYLLSAIKVEGEISNYKFDQRGHLYFSLKDETGALSCVMYKFNQQAGIKCHLDNGLKCVVSGSVSVFERNGVYQLYAKTIEPLGKGDLAQRFEALKRQLQEEGLFDRDHKKPIPAYCKRLGVVTAATGAVIHDICNVTARRNPYVQLILCPTRVQGEGAAEEIAEGIRILDQFGLDCIIVGRGGGSMEDLWPFNEETVVRAVYECETPVISAVGHETDTTLCDYAADLRAPTPSAAAELAVFDFYEAMELLRDTQGRLSRLMEQQLERSRLRLAGCESRLQALHPGHVLEQKKQRLLGCRQQLTFTMNRRMQQARHDFALRAQHLETLSPVKRLTGGYAYVTTQEGVPLTSVGQLKPKQQLTIRTGDGKVLTRVEETILLSKDRIG